jgi:hypothetical protein
MNELIIALTDFNSWAKDTIREQENQLLKVKERQHDLDVRMGKVQKMESDVEQEKKYLIAIRDEQKKKDIEQLTFTAKRREIDEQMGKLFEQRNHIAAEHKSLDMKIQDERTAMQTLELRRKEFDELNERKIAIAMINDDLKKREAADVERKKVLDAREQVLAMREARIQRYADMK